MNPVAASRPRVSGSWGGYYVGAYKRFRAEAEQATNLLLKDAKPLDGPLDVEVHVYVERPKSTRFGYPRGDVDNFAKAVLDSLNGKMWVDDTQIFRLVAEKHWANPGEDGYYTVRVTAIDIDD